MSFDIIGGTYHYCDEWRSSHIIKVPNSYADKLKKVFGTNVSKTLSSMEADLDRRQEAYETYAKDFLNQINESTQKVDSMTQFLTLDIGSNKATIDLSKVRKQGLIFEKTMFGKKPKIVIYYDDRPEKPEVNFELNSEEEARATYANIEKQLNKWAEASNSARLIVLQQELEAMHAQKDALLEEKEVLMDVFNQFKEMMQIMEDDTKTSSLVETIKKM